MPRTWFAFNKDWLFLLYYFISFSSLTLFFFFWERNLLKLLLSVAGSTPGKRCVLSGSYLCENDLLVMEPRFPKEREKRKKEGRKREMERERRKEGGKVGARKKREIKCLFPGQSVASRRVSSSCVHTFPLEHGILCSSPEVTLASLWKLGISRF